MVSSGKHLLQLTYFQYWHRFYAVTEYQSAQILSVMNSGKSREENKNGKISQGKLNNMLLWKAFKGITQIIAMPR